VLGKTHCTVSCPQRANLTHAECWTFHSVIEHALHLNGILSIRIDQKRNKKSTVKVFHDDPDIRVLLLHGERENAGLNIVCASRVFLVESVVNHAFEIQG
jgi:E3 ubiquitin-protein ligase SHPRH